MRIRRATNADRAAVTQLVFGVLAEYGLKPDPAGIDADLSDLEAHYPARGGCFDVLVDGVDPDGDGGGDPNGGRIVGTVALQRVDDRTCELRKMYLHRGVRGRGLGRRLLEHALAEAHRLGFRLVTLETAAVLVEAVTLYRRYGFRSFTPPHWSAQRCDQAYVLELGEPQTAG